MYYKHTNTIAIGLFSNYFTDCLHLLLFQNQADGPQPNNDKNQNNQHPRTNSGVAHPMQVSGITFIDSYVMTKKSDAN